MAGRLVTCRPGADSGSEQLASESRGLYRAATATFARLTREDVARSGPQPRTPRGGVGRIFGYFDTTMKEIAEADAEGLKDLLHAVAAERGSAPHGGPRTLRSQAEHPVRHPCGPVPNGRVRLAVPDGTAADVKVDAWSHRVRGLVCPCLRRDRRAHGGLRRLTDSMRALRATSPTPLDF